MSICLSIASTFARVSLRCVAKVAKVAKVAMVLVAADPNTLVPAAFTAEDSASSTDVMS
jgi:hypothetical protein